MTPPAITELSKAKDDPEDRRPFSALSGKFRIGTGTLTRDWTVIAMALHLADGRDM